MLSKSFSALADLSVSSFLHVLNSLFQPHEVPDKFKSWRERDPARESLGANREETPGREVMTKSRDRTPEGLDLKSRGNRAKQRPAPLQRDMNKVNS